jgi:hypothetical protein
MEGMGREEYRYLGKIMGMVEGEMAYDTVLVL